jgi:glycosyltransferase involved in cell wall biosynthesis
MTRTSNPQLSLIMATVGRVSEPERFVSTLATQTCNDFELIIVDQNEDDRLQRVVKLATTHGYPIRHMRYHERNLSAARNAGIQAARGSIVAFPDDDCWYEPKTIANALRHFEGNTATKGLIGSWIEEADLTAGEILWKTARTFRGVLVSSYQIFARKELVIQAGCFDVRLGLPNWFGAGEETDLMLTLLRQRARFVVVPEVIIHHPLRDFSNYQRSQIFREMRRRSRGAGALYAKHPIPLYVVARGILSPIVRAFASGLFGREGVKQLAMLIGRLEGMVRWRRVYGQARCSSSPN